MSMLKTIREALRKSRKPFEDMYADYILEVQDQNLEAEIRYLQRMNKLNVTFMSNIIEQTMSTVVKDNDFHD